MHQFFSRALGVFPLFILSLQQRHIGHMTNQIFISRNCIAYPPSGAPFEAQIGICKPSQSTEWGWQCQLHLPGIADMELSAYGIDEWHAVQMGMHLVWVELDFKNSTGWRFEWWGGNNTDTHELLPPYGRAVPLRTR